MVRRPVVIQPPPGEAPRQAVVVREGPPVRDKRRITDLVIGILGALVLVAAVALFSVLPRDEPPLPQFEVGFDAQVMEDNEVLEATLMEGDTTRFAFPFDGDSLFRVEVAFEWLDDLTTSLPDRFNVTLIDPDGNVAAGPVEFPNPAPSPEGSDAVPTYRATAGFGVLVANRAPAPSTQLVTAQTHDETAEDVLARVRQETAIGGAGEWILEVTLPEEGAGDCPAPNSFDVRRIAACQQESMGQPDNGNAFQVVLVSFTQYEPVVTPLQE